MGTKPVTAGWKFQSHHRSPRGVKRLNQSQVANGHDLINRVWVMQPPQRPQRTISDSFWLVSTWRLRLWGFRDCGMLREGVEFLHPFSLNLPLRFLYLVVPKSHSLTTNL